MTRSPSLGEKVLEHCRTVCELAHDLHSENSEVCRRAFQELYKSLGALEEVAQRRVDTTTYENHRRQMEVCHLVIPVQATHD